VSLVPSSAKDRIIDYGKVLFGLDEWDEEYYPHVMRDDS
jgi:hypothetical protein